MRYYSTQRPLAPGSFPKPARNAVLTVCNFDYRKYTPEVGRSAYGYIEYEKPIDNYEMSRYELTPVAEKELRLKYIGQDSWRRYVYKDEDGRLWKLIDCCCPREVCEERGDTPYHACRDDFDGEPDYPLSNIYIPIFVKEEQA